MYFFLPTENSEIAFYWCHVDFYNISDVLKRKEKKKIPTYLNEKP